MKRLEDSHLMQAHEAMAAWASPPGKPALHESYTDVYPAALPSATWGYATESVVGSAVYLHILRNHRGKTGMPAEKVLTLHPIDRRVVSIVWMNEDVPVPFE